MWGIRLEVLGRRAWARLRSWMAVGFNFLEADFSGIGRRCSAIASIAVKAQILCRRYRPE